MFGGGKHDWEEFSTEIDKIKRMNDYIRKEFIHSASVTTRRRMRIMIITAMSYFFERSSLRDL